MIGLPEEDQDDLGFRPRSEENARFPHIAAPEAANSMHAVTLRGLGPVPAGNPSGTADLESRGLASHIAAAPIAKPSALDTRKAGDEAELERLQKTGSGISQIKNPFARGALRGLETVGNILLPSATPMIPGTEAHHNLLTRQATGRIGEDELEAEREATTGKTAAETDEAQARARSLDAATAAAGKPKAKEEKWSPFTGYTDADGTPLIHEENSGQVVRASDKQPPTGFKQSAPKAEKPDTPEQQFIDEFTKSHPNATIAQAIAAYSSATQKPERPEKPPRQLIVDPNGKVIELHPGDIIPEGSKTLTGDLTNKPTADEQRRADLAENLNENLATLEEIATRRPDLFGPVAGRVTGLKGALGSNDPDIGTLETIKHQIGMAQISAHGMRSAQGVGSAAESILNSFKNGPDAVQASINAARNSVKTFTADASKTQNRGAAAPENADRAASAKSVSLAAARSLPQNKGKTDDQIRADIKAHGYKIAE